jgi:hypothetical protein
MHCSGGSASNRYSQAQVIEAFADVLGFSQVDGANRNVCLRTQSHATRGCLCACHWSDTSRWDFGEVRQSLSSRREPCCSALRRQGG